jgi:hypothetical protein
MATDYITSFPTKTLPLITDTWSRNTYASLLLRMGYNNIHKTIFFNVACQEWRQTDPATRTMDNFQDHFQAADTDRINNSTTGQSGYNGPTANHAPLPALPPTDDNVATLASSHT